MTKSRPLLPVEVCVALLDKPGESIVEDCESGIFAFAWDIRSNSSRSNEIRIWNQSLIAALNKQKQPDLSLKQVLDSFLPARDLRSTELKRIFSCSQQHVHKLAPQFVAARAPLKADGPNAFTVFKRESIYKFLASRFMGLKPELN